MLGPRALKNTLKKTFEENGLINSPHRLYNCDETFLPLDGTREKAVTLKKAKYAYALGFRADSSSESESSGSGILCGLCSAREPPNLNVAVVFWVDCGNCGDWFHTTCALGDNSCLRQYVCMNCV